MKKKISIVLFLVLSLASSSFAAEGIWTTKTDMPTGRWELSTSVVDGKIYAIGGAGPVYQALRTVEVYDPATDTWTTKSDMPTARQGLSTSVVDGKIYAIGGGASPSISYMWAETFSMVEEYDPATDTWTAKSEMPTPRGWHSASVLDGRIYVIGGSSSVPSGGTAILAVEVYDPATDSWTQKGNIPARIGAGSSSVVDGKIYVIGGYFGLNKVHEYDPVTDTWIQKADMPTRRCGHSTSVLDGKIYAIGGHPGSFPYSGLATVEVYDPVMDTWTTEPDMIIGRCGVRTSVVDGKIYAFGGYMGTELSQMCVTVEEYEIPLVVDFNGDEIVDSLDVCIMIDHWGTDDPLCDIAPSPFGDGIVDVQDLILLSEHLFEEIFPPVLVAYWKLDEAEGDVAYNSIGNNHGIISGDPTWQPTGGVMNGAIEFDGIDDYIIAPFVLNPAKGPFSVFAWIKGGTPGQVIISQTDGAGFGGTWLGANQSDGTLVTNLMYFELVSESVITDGQWHHVGIVWDGSQRSLYVDEEEVANDTSDMTAIQSTGDLYLGAGKNLDIGNFFSGLIDDIRIYNVALTADEIAAIAQ